MVSQQENKKFTSLKPLRGRYEILSSDLAQKVKKVACLRQPFYIL